MFDDLSIEGLKKRQKLLPFLFSPSNQEVYTPIKLVKEMLDKLPSEVWSDPTLKFLDPACKCGIFLSEIIIRLMIGLEKWEPNEKKRFKHIIEKMVFGYTYTKIGGIVTRRLLYGDYNLKGNITEKLFIEEKDQNMKFDIIVGNPPYQKPDEKTKKGGASVSLWPEFVKQSFHFLNPQGYVVYVHPSSWRKPENELWSLLSSKQIEYLEIHNNKDYYGARETGKEVFGVWTSFDWYVLKNTPYQKSTLINDYSGKDWKIDLRDWPWLPSGKFDIIKKLLIESSDPPSNFLCGSPYHSQRKDVVSFKKDKSYKYPVVHNISADGKIEFIYSNTKSKGHFGISKVIINDSGHAYTVLDILGKFGMSQHSMAFPIKNKLEGMNLIKAFQSDNFKQVIWATKWGNFATESKMFKYFRKDFWKEFLSKTKSKHGIIKANEKE